MSYVRSYQLSDYEAVTNLYKLGDLFGGQFDEARDAEDKLAAIVSEDSESILVYEIDGKILGTVSLIENSRVAWLFRFAVKPSAIMNDVAVSLYTHACDVLKKYKKTSTQKGNWFYKVL